MKLLAGGKPQFSGEPVIGAKASWGYTLIEISIALAIMGVLSMLLLGGWSNNIKNERFSGEVRQFADNIRQAQLEASTTQTAACSPVGSTCYWRGTVVVISPAGIYTGNRADGDLSRYLLKGDDLLLDQKVGIKGWDNSTAKSYISNKMGLKIESVGYSNPGCVGAVSIAWLAPDGMGYVACGGLPAGGWTPGARPFTSQESVIVKLKSLSNALGATITINPANGNITTQIQ